MSWLKGTRVSMPKGLIRHLLDRPLQSDFPTNLRISMDNALLPEEPLTNPAPMLQYYLRDPIAVSIWADI